MSGKVRFGLSRVHIAPMGESGVYEVPTHVPGVVNLTTDPQGDQTVFYADNIAYYTTSSNAGYTGDLEMALIPDELLAKLLGWEIDKNGMLVEISDGIPLPFALLYEVNTDKKARRNVFYNCTLARPGSDNKTGEQSIEVSTESNSITMIPVQKEDKNIIKASIELSDTNKDVYDSFYEEVLLPTWAAA